MERSGQERCIDLSLLLFPNKRIIVSQRERDPLYSSVPVSCMMSIGDELEMGLGKVEMRVRLNDERLHVNFRYF